MPLILIYSPTCETWNRPSDGFSYLSLLDASVSLGRCLMLADQAEPVGKPGWTGEAEAPSSPARLPLLVPAPS